MAEFVPEQALAGISRELGSRGRGYALVGGLAVSARSEVRFTRDVDLAVVVTDDRDAEQLVHSLRARGYVAIASVEHETRKRLSTVRLMSPEAVKIDLLFASCGIESEVAERATIVDVGTAGPLLVASAEELLAMKVLSMTERRLQDRLDAQRLLEYVPDLDLERVRHNLDLITQRGYDRDQDLRAKLDTLLAEVRR